MYKKKKKNEDMGYVKNVKNCGNKILDTKKKKKKKKHFSNAVDKFRERRQKYLQ